MAELIKPQTEIEIAFQGKKFTVKYPSSGEMIEIATKKAKLSENQYNELLYQNSQEAGFAIKLINTYCFITVMIPSLREKLNVSSLLEISALDSVELLHVYDSLIVPWLTEWTTVINNRINELKGIQETQESIV